MMENEAVETLDDVINQIQQKAKADAIREFAVRMKDSLMHKHRHLLTVDTDGFEWLTTDAVNTHIDEIAKQLLADMKG